MNPFENIDFIKAPGLLDRSKSSPAAMFRRVFTLEQPVRHAEIYVCGLGYAYYYINGKSISEDLFTAPVSDYTKTLWYNQYDVTSLLKEGENVIAVLCGNGWYNESLVTSWDFDAAPWRDKPKFILSLLADGKPIVHTDHNWICTENTPVVFNELRSGEHFDSRLYHEKWKDLEYPADGWINASPDTRPPRGIFRLCPCEGIREDCELEFISVQKKEENRYIFDFGRNISGYARISVTGRCGDLLELRFAEKLTDTGEMEYHSMQNHYRNAEFALDRFVCCGKPFTWAPKFTYHGFRYVEMIGLRDEDLNPNTIKAVFVHQAVKKLTGFTCSDDYLNKLFEAGQTATLSNLFYMPTDCPTREKLGWCNDAQSSVDQFLTDFDTEKLLAKWLTDIYDAMLPNGQLPGIVPSSGWGYEWGNGPVSEGILFEIPYRIYLHTGNAKYLIRSIPYFKRNLHYYETVRSDGEIKYGLDDWTSPSFERMVKAPFVNEILIVKFLQIASLAAGLADDQKQKDEFDKKLKQEVEYCKRKYLEQNGSCVIQRQTAVSMMIYYGLYDELGPLANQLAKLVEEQNFHFDCGMVGMRYIFSALNRCGLEDYAFRLLTAEGNPSFKEWYKDGMTSLYESWNMQQSLNHHMFSCFMTWIIKTIVGIEPVSPSEKVILIKPYYFEALSFVNGWKDTKYGRIHVFWQKENGKIKLEVEVPQGVSVLYKGKKLNVGKNTVTESIL